MKPLKYYLEKAHKEGWAIGQFNFSDFSEAKGIVQAAVALKSPIILGTSEGESKFFGLEEAVVIRDVLRKKTGLPIFLNLDHGKSVEYIKEAIKAGYDMVHFDGSKLSLEDNIKITKEVVRAVGWKGILVEGEVGMIATDASRVYQEAFEAKETDLTDLKEATLYLKKTKVNMLAISVGNFHGVTARGQSPHLRIDRLKDLKKQFDIPLVLHGGSGTPDGDIKEAIRLGVSKVNINTELRMAFSHALRDALEQQREEIVPYKYFPKVVEAVQEVAEEKIMLFASNNKI